MTRAEDRSRRQQLCTISCWQQENAIQAENTELWEKVFLSADKGMAMMEDGKNYGEFPAEHH